MRLSFLGGTREVTGSCYLVEAAGRRFLVDCGMHQGGREAERLNREGPLNVAGLAPEAIDFILLTHAHIDHSGLIPRLTALGFKGPVHCTLATGDLLRVMLPDAAHIHEKEAEWHNRRVFRRGVRHGEIAPLYTVNQAEDCLHHIQGHPYDEAFDPAPGVRVVFRDAGHILGSALIELWLQEGELERKLVFSGDLGQPQRPIVRDPTAVGRADVLLVESTYGNRRHKSFEATLDELVHAVNDTLRRKHGNLIVPAFAVGRTQEVLYLLTRLVREKRIEPPLEIFVDSPMATAATETTLRHEALLDEQTRELLDWQRHGDTGVKIRFTESVEESRALNTLRGGAIILSASGMCEAGRIRHHLKHNLARRECTLLITGFQAAGTLGRRLVDGAREITLFGERLPVRADIYTLGGLSAHADRTALLDWLGHFSEAPARTFVVHGEEQTALGFAQTLRDEWHWNAEAPQRGQSILL
ncbi:MAG: MBL fold metallo-hydrolase [Halothiobacillaceae bacterium]|nr:MBL fold metallo-hydrolase [Halothiobacillaceae bacterium]